MGYPNSHVLLKCRFPTHCMLQCKIFCWNLPASVPGWAKKDVDRLEFFGDTFIDGSWKLLFGGFKSTGELVLGMGYWTGGST